MTRLQNYASNGDTRCEARLPPVGERVSTVLALSLAVALVNDRSANAFGACLTNADRTEGTAFKILR